MRRIVPVSPVPGDDDKTVAMIVRESRKHETWACAQEKEKSFQFVCRLDPDRARWLSVTVTNPDGSMTTTNEEDEDFESQWGDTGPRRLVDNGRYQLLPDGSYHLTSVAERGAGTYTVTVGPNSFRCLRVIDVPRADETAEIGDAFVEPGGRTVLYRQYRGRGMDRDWEEWQRSHRGHELRIDDAVFFQRDCLGKAHLWLTEAASRPASISSDG